MYMIVRVEEVASTKAPMICAVLALVLSTNLMAQRNTYKQYGSQEGLANLGVTCLLQDRTGYLWVGTDNELYRYDGGGFQSFGHSEGLPSTEILGLAESPKGILWVATQGGVARRVGRKFESVNTSESGWVGIVAFDRLGRVYLEYYSGIVRGVPNGAGEYQFSTVVQGVTRGLFVNGEDVWFGKDGDLWRLTGDSAERIGSRAGLPVARWDAVVQDTLGNLWARSATNLYELPRGQTRFVNRSAGIPQAAFSNLYADRHGRLFVSSDLGVVILDGANREYIDPHHGLPAKSIIPVLLDREESLWMGAYGSGLIRRLGHGEWLSWREEDGLLHNSIWAIQPDHAGQTWVGTSGGLNLLNPNGSVVRSWTTHNGLAGDQVRTIAESADGDLFVGTYPFGISRFNQQGKLLRTYRSAPGLTVERVMALAIDWQRRLWVGGPGGCFRSRASLEASAELTFEQIDIPGTAAGTRVRNILVDEGGIVWLATTHGLARFDGSHWKVFTQADGLKSENLELVVQGQGALWLAYRDSFGITRARIDGDRLETTHFSKQEGLSSNDILGLAFDPSGRLWASTDKGVDEYDQSHWRHYGTEDGLIWDDNNDFSLHADAGGNVWVGTSNGLSRYTASPYPIPDSPPSVVLTTIAGVGQEFQAEDQPVLPYAHSSLLFRFSGLNYSDEARTRFRYRLAGLENDWTETRERSLHFAGLPAGHYVFEVIAAGPNGMWAPIPAQFTFSVKPPWWRSWWFVSICLAVALLLGRAIWFLRVRALMAQKRVLEQQVADRTEELRKSHCRLEEIAYLDGLTSLPNRRMFTDVFRRQLAQAQRQSSRFALVLIDLDRFKLINDAYGHDAGDAVLIEIAVRMKALVRESDCAARLGGDEFGILLSSAENAEDAEVFCKRLADSFANGIPFEDALLRSSASIGIAMFPEDGDTQETLYKSADLALYEMKRAGGMDGAKIDHAAPL
jgi:diguanylate cyclase (GGDEF)-like protein